MGWITENTGSGWRNRQMISRCEEEEQEEKEPLVREGGGGLQLLCLCARLLKTWSHEFSSPFKRRREEEQCCSNSMQRQPPGGQTTESQTGPSNQQRDSRSVLPVFISRRSKPSRESQQGTEPSVGSRPLKLLEVLPRALFRRRNTNGRVKVGVVTNQGEQLVPS